MFTDTKALRALADAATPGPWRAMRDGNQYIQTGKLTPTLVGASRVDGVARPWNPYSFFGGIKLHAEFETARFKDADADFIAAARATVTAMCDEIDLLRERVKLEQEIQAKICKERDHWFKLVPDYQAAKFPFKPQR